MKDKNIDMSSLKNKEYQLQTLVEGSEKEDLAQCVRLISMYISMYKKYFGELPPESFKDLLLTEQTDEQAAIIFDGGLNEAISILDMVIQANSTANDYKTGGITIN